MCAQLAVGSLALALLLSSCDGSEQEAASSAAAQPLGPATRLR